MLCFFLIFFYKAYAQDTTKQALILPEFSLTEKLDKIYSKINTQQIDPSIIENSSTSNLATLLAKNSALTVRSYGVTGLSSLSMRGGNSNHTAVLWNGFNLQDPLNGGYNFSSSNVSFIDNIYIQHGGGSSAYGSGAIGGAIHLNNTPIFNKKYFGTASYKTGSYGLNTTAIKLGHGGEKISTSIRLFKQVALNNFEFKNLTKIGNPTEEYINANMNQYGLLHEFYYKIKQDQTISSQFWFQNNFREIPPSITAFNEGIEEYQKDNWYRWAINWSKTSEKIEYNARTGNFYTTSNYVNSAIDINSIHNSYRNNSEAFATATFFNTQKITLGINNNYTVGISENFNNNPTLNSTALYLAPGLTIFKKIKLNLNIREEYYDGKITPPTYSVNSKYNFYNSFYITSSFSKNYRSPTFNDLYWSGGSALGNIDLQAEYGYSKDIGLEINKITKKHTTRSSLSFYSNIINNQIQWIPEGQIWTPKNIKLVETKGVEFTFSSNIKLSKSFKALLNFSYAYTDAQTIEKAKNESNDILNKQLIYIPYYQSNSLIGVSYKNISLTTSMQYIGYQFTRADNLDWIDSYLLTDIGTQYKLKFKKTVFVFSAQINNVFDRIYESRQWYPMPGLNYEIGIKAIIN